MHCPSWSSVHEKREIQGEGALEYWCGPSGGLGLVEAEVCLGVECPPKGGGRGHVHQIRLRCYTVPTVCDIEAQFHTQCYRGV